MTIFGPNQGIMVRFQKWLPAKVWLPSRRVSFYKSMMGGKDGKVQCLTIWATYFRFKNAQDTSGHHFRWGLPKTTASGEVSGFYLNKNLGNPSEIISKTLKDVNHFLSGDNSWMYPYQHTLMVKIPI